MPGSGKAQPKTCQTKINHINFRSFLRKKTNSKAITLYSSFYTHMGLRSMKKVIESFWVTAGKKKQNVFFLFYNKTR